MKKLLYTIILSLMLPVTTLAQVGKHRNDFAVGVNGGYLLSEVKFTPTVSQKQLGGMTGGMTFRYVCEKYFKTICSVYAEVNYTQTGWKEEILDKVDQPVKSLQPDPATGQLVASGAPETYQRNINYLQIPIFAHLAWGREVSGFNFFFHAGPQFGIYLSESTKTNFNLETPNLADRVNTTVAQYNMPVEHKFDYGIAVGGGAEYSHPKVGHFLAEARYYYGLGNMYGDTKRDFFANSNMSNIVVKLTYLFDVVKTKGQERK